MWPYSGSGEQYSVTSRTWSVLPYRLCCQAGCSPTSKLGCTPCFCAVLCNYPRLTDWLTVQPT